MFLTTRRRRHGDKVYEYLDVAESRRVAGKVRRITLWTLGRRDQLDPQRIDALIHLLRRLASPQGADGIRLDELEVNAIRAYGGVLVARRLWEELGLDGLLTQLSPLASGPFEEAVFRMVANRLLAPSSKLGLVDWVDENGHQHAGWQGQVEWPSGQAPLSYHQYLGAMDLLLPQRERIEEQVFDRTTQLLSLPLRLVFYDVTSTYFEGDGVCELAGYGHSSDHREDRAQVVVGLAVTQEGLPITHRVFRGNTVDVTTLQPMADELKRRFGLQEPVLVGDRGMFSEENVTALEASGFRYVLSLRSRQQEEFGKAMAAAQDIGLPKPRDLGAERTLAEVALEPGHRHVVVYSALRARHDFEVRDRRLRRVLEPLRRLHQRARDKHLSERAIVARATRLLAESKVGKFFSYEVGKGRFDFRLRRDLYRRERHLDGIFVLKTNHATLRAEEILASYLQLQEVERSFRVVKSLLKLRPIFHWRQRRVEAHIFIVFLAFLLAKVLELRLRAAGLDLSIAHALDRLDQLKAVEHSWANKAIVVRRTSLQPDLQRTLAALGIRLGNPVLRVTKSAAA